MTERNVLVRHDDGVVTVTLNRPGAANSLSTGLLDELAGVLGVLANDPAAHLVVLTGAGERHFCAGADLKQLGAHARGDADAVDVPDVFTLIEQLPQPTIAAVNGDALGGGLELALACDLRLAAQEARLGLPEIVFGALPAGGGTQRLPLLVGEARAKELIFSGRLITADEGAGIGLLSAVTPRSQLPALLEHWTGLLRSRASYALRTAKTLIHAARGADLVTGLRREHDLVAHMGTPELRAEAQARATAASGSYAKLLDLSK